MDDQDSLIESNSANGDSVGGGSCLGTSSNSDSNSNNNNCTGTTTTDDNDFVDHFHHPSERSQLLTAEFNQDGGCLAIGTANGFSVHNLHPQYKLSVERSLNGGIGGIEMLFRCNLIALVGGGFDPHAALHRVLIWDDNIPKEIGELSFRQIVLRVKLRKDTIAVALRDRVYVYHLADLSLRDKIYTADNLYGLLSLSTNIQDMVLACPSVTLGHVRVELYGLRKTMLIEAHESTLRSIQLTASGGKLATASCKGTIIRVFDVPTSQSIYEFRRGVERAQITCLAFSIDDQWLSCSSDKGTTHIFYLQENQDTTFKRKKKILKERGNGRNIKITGTTNGVSSINSNNSSISVASSVGSSFLNASGNRLFSILSSTAGTSQPKSVCQIRGVPHPLACAFIGDAPHLIAVVGWDHDGNGVLLISEFAAHQEARRVAYHVLIKSSSTADETEEEKRRRRARGWIPSGIGSNGAMAAHIGDDDPRMYFGHLRISDEMAEEAHRFKTQTADDDFCEVIVEPRKEPTIEDQPLSSSQEHEQKWQVNNDYSAAQSSSSPNTNKIEEIDFTDNTTNHITDNKRNRNNSDENTSFARKEEALTEIENTLFDEDYAATQDSVTVEPLEDEDDDKDNNGQ